MNRMKNNIKAFIPLVGILVLLFSSQASAQLMSDGVLDQVVIRFAERSKLWADVILSAARWLFWTLGAISLVWTFGLMALRKADIQEFFSEFIKFIMFFGFFMWLLEFGPAIATSIIDSLSMLGSKASKTAAITPSRIMDIGFKVWSQAIKNSSGWSPVDSFVGLLLSAGVLIILALVAINMMLLMVSAWFLMYAGIFFLGFGGSRWTSDMAINYYKTVLGMGAQILTMVLLLAIGYDLLSEYYAKMNTGSLNFNELAVMIVFCIALLLLTNTLPQLISGIITGASVGNAGAGSFGAGAAMGAAMTAAGMAAGGAAMVGSAISGTVTGGAGAVSAVQAAMQAAAGGGDLDTGLGSISGSNAGSDSPVGAGDTPFAQAAGLGADGGSGSDGGTGSDGAGSDGGSGSDGGTGSSGADGSGSAGSSGSDGAGSDGGSGSDGGTDTSSGADGSSGSDGGTDTSSGAEGSSDSGGGTDTSTGGGGGSAGSSGSDGGTDTSTGGAKTGLALAMATVGELGKGIKSMAVESAKDKISKTAGGKLADRIKNPKQDDKQDD